MNEIDDVRPAQAFSKWLMVVLYAAMVLFAMYGSSFSISAGDTWVAMACGRHIMNHGVTNADPFSFNSHAPGPTPAELEKYSPAMRNFVARWCPSGWINQNWLAHVIFYEMAQRLGYDSLVVWKVLTYILVVFMLYGTARIMGAHAMLAAGFACFAMYIGRTFIDIRPQGFSNFCVALFLLILVLTTYRDARYIWLIVPQTIFWSNVHGGYIYVFITLIPFILIHLLTSLWKDRFVSIGRRGILHVSGAMIAAFVASIVLSPYHVTNLTHTFVISVSKDAELWRNVAEWFSPFNKKVNFGQVTPFFIMFGMSGLIFLAWLAAIPLRPKLTQKAIRKLKPEDISYSWPKVDLALLVVWFLTIYMAIRSRRFIPLAAIAACPMMAVMLDQTIRMLLARRRFNEHNQLVVGPMPDRLVRILTMSMAGITLVFAVAFGWMFKKEYLDANPYYLRSDSLFVRMTTSYDKPVGAIEFLRLNKLTGRIFHPWTEGAYVSWGQDPDPVTGKTPIPVFIDGRAQAAYPPDKFLRYMDISVGGPSGRMLRGGGELSTSQVNEIAQWLDTEFKQYRVSVVLTSTRKFEAVCLVATRANWRPVYMDERFMLLVDTDYPECRKLCEDLSQDRVKFPDEFSRELTHAYISVRANDSKWREIGLNRAEKALSLRPCGIAAQQVLLAGRDPSLSARVTGVCREFLADFVKNKKKYDQENGFGLRAEAAEVLKRAVAR